MLKLTLNIRDGIGVTKFLKLVPFLKKSQLVIRRKRDQGAGHSMGCVKERNVELTMQEIIILVL
jgi:hypothetical protein